MYRTVRKTQKFNTDNSRDLAEYDQILNNPLCTVISERREKLSQMEYNEETGKPVSRDEHVILVVTWEEKTLV